MFQTLLLIFLTVPLLEIYLLIKVGSIIGAVPTVFMVVFTAVLGAFLIRLQGLATMSRVRSMLMQGEIPAMEVMEGLILLISGALLLTPGFFTDTLGFLCLIRPIRLWLIRQFLSQRGGGVFFSTSPHSRRQNPRSDHTIEGEFWREDDDKRP